jgi:hypothetical protein
MTRTAIPEHYRRDQYAQRSFEELAAEVERLYESEAMQPRDISAALRLNLAAVIRILGERARGADAVQPELLRRSRALPLLERAMIARRLFAAGTSPTVIAWTLHLALPLVLEALRVQPEDV